MTRPSVLWLSGEALALRFAVEEQTLLRYAKRGMLGAQWDAADERWLYDLRRVGQLFLPRGADVSNHSPHLGVLGTACLAGVKQRRPPVLPARRSGQVGARSTRCA